MNTDFIALASFVVITTFTPGPNNISSASMGLLHGYKKSLGYLFGIVTGFFLIMLICGWISATIIQLLPSLEIILRIFGAIYILWLAFHTLKANYSFKEEQQTMMGFSNGFFLQLLNPKVTIYGLTLYSTFLGDAVANWGVLLISALAFTGVGFCAISSWTLFGATIRTYLNSPFLKSLLNTILFILLVFTAIEISGILNLLF